MFIKSLFILMPLIDGVEFSEEKVDLGALPPRVLPRTVSDKLGFTSWLMSHGISEHDATAILAGIIALNFIIIAYVVVNFIILK